MIPTLIYSFYGMNVILPFQNNAFAVFGILIFSLTASFIGVILLNIDAAFKRHAEGIKKRRAAGHVIKS
jgi:hypothetical protein